MFRMVGPALLIAAVGIAQTSAAAEAEAGGYGRGGGPVGADWVTCVAQRSGTLSFYRQLAFDLQPGRAGGEAPTLVHRKVPYAPGSAPVAIAQRYGRAGYPLIGMR